MKRTISLLLFLGFFYSSFSQEAYVALNYSALQKKLEKNNSAIKHPKKSLNAKTWLQRGEIMRDVFKVDVDQIFEGMDKLTLKAVLKEPISTTKQTINDVPTEVLTYERVTVYFQNNKLERWEKTKSLVENPLDEAYAAFVKASELDTDGKLSKKIHDNLIELKDLFKQSGMNTYYADKKKRALEDFMMVLKINELDYFKGEIDTIMFQYTGIIAREIKDMETATAQYEKLAKIGFGGPNTYLLLKEDYLSAKDTAKAIDVLERGFSVYPDSTNLLANLIDLYIRNDRIEDGIKKIDESIVANPKKGEVYYWKGRLLLNSEGEDKIEQALEVYQKAIEFDETIYYVYYDIGLIYFLQGQDLFTQAGTEKDKVTREVMNDLATEKFNSAFPMLEKAVKFNKEFNEIMKESLDTLKRIYYRLQMTDKYEEADKRLIEMRKL